MTATERVIAIVATLKRLHIPYMITGSLASNLYGIIRSTADADIVIQARSEDINRIAASLREHYALDPQMSFESVTMTTRYVLESIDHEFKIELFLLSDDRHDRERFQRRVKAMMDDQEVDVPTPEDVIIGKLRWIHRVNRNKDKDDAMNVLAVQGDALDWDYIHKWCTEHGTMELLQELRDSIPPI
jgi:predicted nucleotidyltransferase